MLVWSPARCNLFAHYESKSLKSLTCYVERSTTAWQEELRVFPELIWMSWVQNKLLENDCFGCTWRVVHGRTIALDVATYFCKSSATWCTPCESCYLLCMQRPTTYDHKREDQRWQERWLEEGAFRAPENPANPSYILDMFPYPSGSGLHVGHVVGYVGSDVLARYARLVGRDVLHPMGWDSFGLPAERYAIKAGVPPQVSTEENIATYRRQLQQLGLSYDWDREIATSSPEYYRWTQWLFQFLYKQGLAYRAGGFVNWCPEDQTVLANEQVVAGRCERCGSQVVQRNLEQWYFKITDFAEELLEGLEVLDWPEHIKTLQRNWIGRSEGAAIRFAIEGLPGTLEVYTTRPDTLYGATYLVVAPEHPALTSITSEEQRGAVAAYQTEASKSSELERTFTDRPKTGVWTGAYALHPLTGERLQVWVADYVLTTYGTGAVMAVPAHDERDFAFAKTFGLPIRQVVAPSLVQSTEPAKYRPDQPVVKGESVIVFVQHPTEDRYLGLDWLESAWGAKTLLTGTIDDLSPEETLRKEILEETGYTNLASIEKLGVIDGLFYHLPKQTNKLVRGHVYVVRLENEDKVAIEAHEQQRHSLSWLTQEELAGFLTPETHQYALRWLEGWQPCSEPGSLVNSGDLDGLSTEEAKGRILDLLGSAGERRVTYRLRDWLVSRQRYWGAPIPIAYDKAGNEHLIPDDQLPVVLPENVAFTPSGASPLAAATEWANWKNPSTGETLTRELDTLDTFVCSSWYFLRYPTPNLEEAAFDASSVGSWLPVQTYVGGDEHAVMHLLYSRFICRALYRAGLVPVAEPFQKFVPVGKILGPDNQKMSKSKGNVISPDEIVSQYGADALRCYELFMGPFDQEKPWSTSGILGVRRFLDKTWRLFELPEAAATKEEQRALAQAVKAVRQSTEQLKFNTAVSGLMECVNALGQLASLSKSTRQDFLVLLSPFAPHMAESLWSEAGFTGFAMHATMSEAKEEFLAVEEETYAVQVNGKVRASFQVEVGMSQDSAVETALRLPNVAKYLEGQKIQKQIVIPGKLISLVVTPLQ